jgi:DNA polymerase III epsilon subunit-like protein
MIVLDIESSGTNPWKHSIVSIGAIDFDKPESSFYEECKIWEEAHIDPEALEVNGFTSEEIKDSSKQSEGGIVESFLDWAGDSADHTIAGHNPFFDLFFIQAVAQRNHLNFPLAHRIIDLHSICYFHMLRRGIKPPLKKQHSALNSDKVMEYVGITTEPKPHNALNGAKWESEAFMRLFFDRSLFQEFKDYPIPWLQEKRFKNN